MRLERMTTVQAERYFKKRDIVMLAIGSIENHGRHAALGTDTLVPNRILELVEQKDEIMILPTIPYGNADFHTGFPGSVSIGADALYSVIDNIFANMLKWGVKKFIILNGHGGNMSSIEKASAKLFDNGAAVFVLNWWDLVGQLNSDWISGHGDFVETSAIMAIDENLVDKSEFADQEIKSFSDNIVTKRFRVANFNGANIIMPRGTHHAVGNGWSGANHPKNASVEQGEAMLNTMADYIKALIDELEVVKL